MYYVYYDFDSKLKLSFDITTIQYGRHMWSGAIFETEKKRILGCHSDIPTCMPYIFFTLFHLGIRKYWKSYDCLTLTLYYGAFEAQYSGLLNIFCTSIT